MTTPLRVDAKLDRQVSTGIRLAYGVGSVADGVKNVTFNAFLILYYTTVLGLPGTRIMIHDFVLGNPLKKEHYPEPDYEDVARARILHVFKDRGLDEDEAEAPFDWDRVPEPLGFR